MPWRAALRDPEFQKSVVSMLTTAIGFVIPIMNHYRIRQLQEHVRCDDECKKAHGPSVKRTVRLKKNG